MEVINIEKVDKTKPIVLLGKEDDIIDISILLGKNLFWYPNPFTHFTEYPKLVERAYSITVLEDGAIATQSIEFLDYMLRSKHEFQIVTIRKDPGMDKYRLRVLSREEALEDRESFSMELRV